MCLNQSGVEIDKKDSSGGQVSVTSVKRLEMEESVIISNANTGLG